MEWSKSKRTIDLASLCGQNVVEFYFSSTIDNKDKEVKQELKYLLDTIRFLLNDIPVLHSDPKREKLEKQLANNNFSTFDSLEKFVNNFNRFVNSSRQDRERQRAAFERALSSSSQSSAGARDSAAARQSDDSSASDSSTTQSQVVVPASVERRCQRELLGHILSLCYWRAVDDPEALNHHYKAFTSQTYGETSFEYVELVLQRVEFRPDDIFIDLGSGVGQVVLHVAASLKCKRCIGIELADLPAAYASKMEREFKKWMGFFGRPYTPFELLHEDFLAEVFADTLRSGTVLFANNFAFEPQLDDALKVRFEELQEGSRIISSKTFCSSNHRLSERATKDVGAMMRVQEFSPMKDGVSWTANEIKYFLHIIDRTKVEDFFKEQKEKIADLKQTPNLLNGFNKHLPSKRVESFNLRSAKKIMRRAHEERQHRKVGRPPANVAAAAHLTLRPRNKFSPVPKPPKKRAARTPTARSPSGARRPALNASVPASSASSRGSSVDRRRTKRSFVSHSGLSLSSMNDSALSHVSSPTASASTSAENKRSPDSSPGSPQSSTSHTLKSSSSSSSSTSSIVANKRRYTGPSPSPLISPTPVHSRSGRHYSSEKAQEAPIAQTNRNGATVMGALASKCARNVLSMAPRAVPRRRESAESSVGASGSGSSSEQPTRAPQAEEPARRSLQRPMVLELHSNPRKSTTDAQPPPAAAAADLPAEVTDEAELELPSKGSSSSSKRRRRTQSKLSMGAQRKRRRGNAKRLLASTPTLGLFHDAAYALTTSPEPPTLPALSPDSSDGAALSSSTARFNSANQEVRSRPVSEERKLTVDGLRLEVERTLKEGDAEDEKLIDDFYYKVLRPELLSQLPQIRAFAASSGASSDAASAPAGGASGPGGKDAVVPVDSASMERLRERLENVRRDHLRICSEIAQLIYARLALIPLASDGNSLVLELLLHTLLRLLADQPIPNSAFASSPATLNAGATSAATPPQPQPSANQVAAPDSSLFEPVSPTVTTPPAVSTVTSFPVATLPVTSIIAAPVSTQLSYLADQPHNSSAPPTPKKKLSPRIPGRPRGRPPRLSESSNPTPVPPAAFLPSALSAASPAPALPTTSTLSSSSTPPLPPQHQPVMYSPMCGLGQIVRPMFAGASPLGASLLPLPVLRQATSLATSLGGSPSFPPLVQLARLSCSQAPIPMRLAASPMPAVSLPLQRPQLYTVPSPRAVSLSAIPTVNLNAVYQLSPIQFSPPNKPQPQQHPLQQPQIPAPFAAPFGAAPAPGIMAPMLSSAVLMPPPHFVRPSLSPQLVFASSLSQ